MPPTVGSVGQALRECHSDLGVVVPLNDFPVPVVAPWAEFDLAGGKSVETGIGSGPSAGAIRYCIS